MGTHTILFGAFALVGLILGIIFDQIVKMEYREFKSQWDIDGKPRGFFWIPSDVENSTIAFWRCWFSWTFITPEWIRKSGKAYKFIIYFRITYLVGFIIWIIWIIWIFSIRSK